MEHVANWFHDSVGELFTVAETPFSRDDIVSVVNDDVDPVQQVVVDSDRYYGIINYTEHDGWYEYTRYDDMAGEVNVGVCAQCVIDADTVSDVVRTIGDDTDTAREKMADHYDAVHDTEPESVETGATLLSNTTINGNEAIHLGMDGDGSGVDADFFRGGGAVQQDVFYEFESDDPLGTVLNQQVWGGEFPKGFTVDTNGCYWISDDNADSIYKTDTNLSIEIQIDTPGFNAGGLGSTNDSCIWTTEPGSSDAEIYKLNRTGSIIDSFISPSSSPEGIDGDSDDCIWHVDGDSKKIYKTDQSGTVEKSFQSPSSNPTGIGITNNDLIWHADLDADTIYGINSDGSTDITFSSPSSFPYGIGINDNKRLLNMDQSENLYTVSLGKITIL